MAKLISISEIPYSVKGEAVSLGETFEETGVAVKELLGRGLALEATAENIKKVEAMLDVKTAVVKPSDKKKSNS